MNDMSMVGRSRHLCFFLSIYTRFCIHFTHDFIFVLHIMLYSLRTWFYIRCAHDLFTYIVYIRLIGIRVTHDVNHFTHVCKHVAHDVNSFCTWLAHVLHMMWILFTHEWHTCYTWCEFFLHMIGIRVTHNVNSFYTWLV